jgi:hypothetical protein
MYEPCCSAETGETKPSPLLRAATRIKLWILELPVIFMVSLQQEGVFRDSRLSGLMEACGSVPVLKAIARLPFLA